MFFFRELLLISWAYKFGDWSIGYQYLRQNCFWRQQSREKIGVLFGTILFQISTRLFLSIFVIFWLLLAVFGEFDFQNFVTNQLFGWNFCVELLDTIYHHQDYEQVNFYKKMGFNVIGWSLRDGTTKVFLYLAQKWNLSTKFENFYFFHQHS